MTASADDWPERLRAAVAATLAARAARRAERAELAARRAAGLEARHAAKLARRTKEDAAPEPQPTRVGQGGSVVPTPRRPCGCTPADPCPQHRAALPAAERRRIACAAGEHNRMCPRDTCPLKRGGS